MSQEKQVVQGHQTKLVLRAFADRQTAASEKRTLGIPTAQDLLDNLIVEKDFINRAGRRTLIQLHQMFGSSGPEYRQGYPLARARRDDRERFQLARSLVRQLIELIEDHYRESVGCDLALLCALVPGSVHRLHADNALVICPRHGSDAEQLRRLDCQCPDIEVRPNHTPWRKYSALLYLGGDHRGGDIVFGEGPNLYGRLYRQQIEVRGGLLVLSPSNEFYFHHTTPVSSGVRYSMNCWFTADREHIARDWD